ncbi:MAG: amidohydrolase family protein, partial [Bacteroidota bacterium]|nr:amidohydrolase family protein [Bacteroidota bacterium]
MDVSYSIEGNIVDIERRKIFKGKISVEGNKILDILPCDVKNDCFILPGLIDSHVHIESSMLIPSEFAKNALRHGTVASLCDPHEIANVCGIEGVLFMLENAQTADYNFFFGAPSCVPATFFETSGAILDSASVGQLLRRKDIFFLSEMMNYPGVINMDNEVIKKLDAARKYKKPIDGHAPGLVGNDLKKYASQGISTDHESFSYDEAVEKINCGMSIMIREGSAARNFESLYKLIDVYPEKIMLCTDDIHPDDFFSGYIDSIVRRALSKGLDVFNILKAACINPVKHYKIPVGTLKKNDWADFIVVNNLKDFKILQTY